MPLMANGSSSGSTNSFWKEKTGARPGRVAGAGGPQRVSSGKSEKGAANTFQAYQASVSDAWDIEEPLTPVSSHRGTGGGPGPVGQPRFTGSNNVGDNGVGASPETQSVTSITPVHTHQNVARKSPSRATVGSRSSSSTATPTSSSSSNSRSSSSFQPSDPETEKERSKCAKFDQLLSGSPVNMSELEKLAWSGVPRQYRSRVWQMLCGYQPPGRGEEVVKRRREEYQGYVNQYFNNKEGDSKDNKDTFRQIAIDVPRMSPLVGLFQQRCVQEMVERILYIWAIRHPASGYVQGINDLVTPFLMVFLQDFVDKDVTKNSFVFEELDETIRKNIEADSFWCMTKVLDGIQDNYTFAQPGIQVKIRQLEELLKRVDVKLHNHIVGHDVQYLQFSFRWMNNLLLRELPLNATIRLWDTYLSESDGFNKFHLYVCAAFLCRWKQDLESKKDFQSILLFIQNVPTAKWHDKDISLLVAEAYQLKYMFADAPSHLTECRINKPFL